MPSPFEQLFELIVTLFRWSHLFSGDLLFHFFELILDTYTLLLHFHIHYHFLLLFLFGTFFVPLGPSIEELCSINLVYLSINFLIENHFIVLIEFVPVFEILFQNLRERSQNTFLHGPLLLNRLSFFPCFGNLFRIPFNLSIFTIDKSIFNFAVFLLFLVKFQSIEYVSEII